MEHSSVNGANIKRMGRFHVPSGFFPMLIVQGRERNVNKLMQEISQILTNVKRSTFVPVAKEETLVSNVKRFSKEEILKAQTLAAMIKETLKLLEEKQNHTWATDEDKDFPFFCRVALNLSEAQIANNLEAAAAPKTRAPLKLFTYLCNRQLTKVNN